jgi:signal transduction histidine kinase
MGIADVFLKLNQTDSSTLYAKNALAIADSAGLPNEKLEALNLLTTIFEGKSNIDSAYAYQKQTLVLKDGALSADHIRHAQLIAFNEEMKKQEELTQQRRRSTTIIISSLVVTVLFISLITSIVIRHNQQRKKAYTLLQKQKEQTEQAYSQLKATQAQLVQKEKMASLGELIAGIAHEIQNPLNFVNNFSTVNKELVTEAKQALSGGNYPEVAAVLSDIENNEEKISHHGKRADSIVKGMLQHARASTGKKEPTDINKLAEEYLRLSFQGMRAKDKSFNAAIETHFDNTLGQVTIVPQDIGRVLLNLFNNAFYAVQEKKAKLNGTYEPVVSVRTNKDSNSVQIIVKDNGTGMPQQVADKVFQPFFTTKPTGEGIGLGLSLSYDIVTKGHGGELKVESKEGEGTEFVVQLPII